MSKRNNWPREFKSGSVVVKVYEVAHATARTGKAYVLAWQANKVRKTQKFADPEKAFEEARLKAAQLAAGRIEGAEMSSADRDELQAARKRAGNVPLLAALDEWFKARELTNGQVIPAAEMWAARNATQRERVQIKDVVARFLKAKTALGIQTAKNHGTIFDDLTRDFGEIYLDSFMAPQINAWLAKKNHPSTRNTYRKHLVSLFRWAQKQGFLSRDLKTEAEQTDRAKENDQEIGIIDVPTFRSLLSYFHTKYPEYLPALVLAGFCGLRRSEVHAQKWADIELTRGHVKVTKAKRGTPSRRIVPLPEAAIAWLMLCPDRTDFICGNLAIDRIRHIARDAGFTIPENAFRHSFITNRCAQTGNVAETALESGNSPTIIFRHYRELTTKAEGAAWFESAPNIAPVVPMESAG